MLRGPRNLRPRDMDISKLLSATRDCSLYKIEVAAWSHILKLLFRAWVPVGYRSGIGQMMKDVSSISFVCLFSIFQSRNDPVWSSPHLVTQHIDGVLTEV
jgi:hypothetical protein